MSAQKQKGFTLIELLIVISIIAVLSTIGLLAYSSFLKSARDAKRQSDLKFIQSALEDYHADQHYYPLLAASSCTNGQIKTGCVLTNSTGAKSYITQVPSEPVASRSNYKYEPSSCDSNGCASYCLSASMESLIGSKTEGSCPTPTLPYNFTVTRP